MTYYRHVLRMPRYRPVARRPRETAFSVTWDRLNYFCLRLICFVLDRIYLALAFPVACWVLSFFGLSAWTTEPTHGPIAHALSRLPSCSLLVIGLPSVVRALFLLSAVVLTVQYHGATPGMTAENLRILTWDGRKPEPQRILLRHILSIVSAAPLFLGYIWALFDSEGRTWHDILSGTVVVFGDEPPGHWRSSRERQTWLGLRRTGESRR